MYSSGMLENVATSLLNNIIVAIFEFLLKYLGGAQDQVGRACAPVCPTLATPLLLRVNNKNYELLITTCAIDKFLYTSVLYIDSVYSNVLLTVY